MNGKIKTEFAALFAVALMITVCVVPVVGNEDVQAASAAPEGVSGIEIQLFTEDSTDFSDMVYFNGNKLPETLDATEWSNYGQLWININEKSEYFGKFLRWGQVGVGNDEIKQKMGITLPMIQTSYITSVDHNVGVKVNEAVEDRGSVETSVTINGNDIYFGEREVISSIKFIEGAGNETLGINKDALTGGDYEVELYINGSLVADKKLVFESDNDFKTLKGKVQDAKGNVIEGAVVAYTIDGDADTTKTKTDGTYEIKAKPGSVVNVTGITYENDLFTFDKTYSYGTVVNDVNVLNDNTFAAKEIMGTATVVSKTYDTDERYLINGVSISMAWWYQTTNQDSTFTNSTNAPTGVTKAGTVKVLGKTNDKGVVLFSYVEPTIASGASVTCVLIANASNVTGFTFTKKSPDASNQEISTNISGASGTDDVSLSDQNGKKATVSFTPNEEIGIATVKSKTNELVVGAEVNMKWWYQTGTEKPYDVTDDAPEWVTKEGSVTVLGKTDESGNVLFTYTAPTLASTGGKTFELIANASDINGYTFENKDPDAQTGESIDNNIKDAGGTGKATSGKVTLTAKEESYTVSGTIEAPGIEKPEGSKYYPAVTITYTNGVGSTVVLDKVEAITDYEYEYSFQVIKGNSTTISISLDGYTFKPVTTASVYADLTDVNFTGESTAQIMEYVVPAVDATGWTVSDLTNLKGKAVTFEYTVDGVEYSTPVVVNGSGVATFKASYVNTNVQVLVLSSVSAEGYNVDLSSGSVTTTTVTPVKFFFYSNKIDVPVAGLELTIMNGNKVAGTITTDKNGTASLDIVNVGGLTAIYDGIYKTDIESVPGTDSLYGADVKSWIPVAQVTVQYISSVNNSDVVGGAVGGLPVADAAYKFAAMPGDSVALKAPSIDNFEFVAWMVDGVVVSESADYTLKVDGDCHVDALYSAVHYEEPAEGLSMNVLVIGIVILILGILAVAYGIISKKQ